MHKYNNCVQIQFEIGHEASLRSEVTREGFTHDWQVYVRGVDNAEIHHFVDKVVFNLHESFPKPKRVFKEPPYEVRESGYASFTFPIEIYLKNKEEPRKLDFMYDLSLNTSGPVRQSTKELRLFNNPSDDFRRKLIRGGGVGVGSDLLSLTDNNSHNSEDKMSSKRSNNESSKKHKSKESLKPDEVRTSNQFADLFGTPIKTAKLSPTPVPKKTSESKHSSESKVSSKSSKHSPHKEKDRESSKKEPIVTLSGKEKDRERSREKDKKPDKCVKRPLSPTPVQPPSKIIKEDVKIPRHDEIKERDKLKASPSDLLLKSEKKEKKKDKKSRDEKDKKDRHKDHESRKEVPVQPPVVEKEKVIEKVEKNKAEIKEIKDTIKKSPKNIKEEKIKDKSDKDKYEPIEKQRHKHKKKEKNKKEERGLREKDKIFKKVEKPPVQQPAPKERSPSPPPQPLSTKSRPRSPSPKMTKNPLTTLMSELPSSDKGSDSESSSNEDSRSSRSVEKMKIPSPLPPPPAPSPPLAVTPERVKDDKFIKEKVKRKEKKNLFKDDDSSRKKKRKIRDKEETSPEVISKPRTDIEQKVIRDEPMEEDVEEKLSDRLSEPSLPESPPAREEEEISRSRSPTPPFKFTEEYVMQLKDLQQKIMTLEDNQDLQRVVQVIAETGQYEITKKTFDFDLCALDKTTVKRLQELFFVTS